MNQSGMVRRARHALAMLLVMIGTITVTATAASADTVCGARDADPLYNICFAIDHIGGDRWAVYVGIDITMSQSRAQNIANNRAIDAWVMGDDPIWDNAEFNVPLTWITAGPSGLSAEFELVVPEAALDEDAGGADELYARVRLLGPSGGQPCPCYSHNLNGNWG
jgi:hypothetical protein